MTIQIICYLNLKFRVFPALCSRAEKTRLEFATAALNSTPVHTAQWTSHSREIGDRRHRLQNCSFVFGLGPFFWECSGQMDFTRWHGDRDCLTSSICAEVPVQGDEAPRGPSFDDTFVKCPAAWLAVSVAALLPSWITRNLLLWWQQNVVGPRGDRPPCTVCPVQGLV